MPAASTLGAHRHYRNNQEKRREGNRATHIYILRPNAPPVARAMRHPFLSASS
jgi:hypothetical protein